MRVEIVDVPDWFEQLWAELRFRELVTQAGGGGFQQLFHRVMKAVDGDDFLDVRPIGKYGDFKCDGWEMSSRTCYAVYGPLSVKRPDEVRRKISDDLLGAVRGWPEMRSWRLVHNDFAGLNVLVAAALVELKEEVLRVAPRLEVLPPWGPRDLWWLLRQAPDEARRSLLGTHGWRLNRDRFQHFGVAGDDPVSVAAGRSVAQLMDGFAVGGVIDPVSASTFAGTLAMFLLGDETSFGEQSNRLVQLCRDDPFESMVTSIAFCVTALRLWEAATCESPQFWVDMLNATGATVPYVSQVVLSARLGVGPDLSLPGHPDDQRKITMNLGTVTALTLRLTADRRVEPLVSVLQDLLIGLQRERTGLAAAS